MRDKKTNIRLRMLDYAVHEEAYSTVLASLSQGVSKAASRIPNVDSNSHDAFDLEISELIADEEAMNLDHLIGTAFVACQPWITSITRRANAFADTITDFETPKSIRNFPPMYDADLSKVEVMWGVANFYKHRDEKILHTETRIIMNKLGMTNRSTGNLRTAADSLGFSNYQNLQVLEDTIRNWGEAIRSRAYSELR